MRRHALLAPEHARMAVRVLVKAAVKADAPERAKETADNLLGLMYQYVNPELL